MRPIIKHYNDADEQCPLSATQTVPGLLSPHGVLVLLIVLLLWPKQEMDLRCCGCSLLWLVGCLAWLLVWVSAGVMCVGNHKKQRCEMKSVGSGGGWGANTEVGLVGKCKFMESAAWNSCNYSRSNCGVWGVFWTAQVNYTLHSTCWCWTVCHWCWSGCSWCSMVGCLAWLLFWVNTGVMCVGGGREWCKVFCLGRCRW